LVFHAELDLPRRLDLPRDLALLAAVLAAVPAVMAGLD
jgi:hypothetical protein